MRLTVNIFGQLFSVVAIACFTSSAYAQGPGIVDGGGIIDGGGVFDAPGKSGVIDGGGVFDGGGVLDRLPGSGVIDGGGVFDGGGIVDRFDQYNSTYTMNSNATVAGLGTYNYDRTNGYQTNGYYTNSSWNPGTVYNNNCCVADTLPTTYCCENQRRGLFRRWFR